MKNQKKQPPVSATKKTKVTDAKMFAPLTKKTLTQTTKKSIVPTAKPKAKQKPMPDTSNKTKTRQRITSSRDTIKGGSIGISPVAKSKSKPMTDTSKTYNQRLMMKSSSMPMPALDSSMTKIPKGYAGELYKGIGKQESKQKTIATMRKGTVSSNGDTTMGPPKRMKMTKISEREFNR